VAVCFKSQSPSMQFFKDLSLSTAIAGAVAVLVGFTSSVALVFQAALAFDATPAQITSWIWALGIGVGLCSLVPSLILRQPFMVAWSTPGSAVLAAAGGAEAFSMGEAIGAFMVSALLITVAGATGWFERVMSRIPLEIASALLAGVLARFGMDAFMAAQTNLPLVLVLLAAYLLARRWLPRYAVVCMVAIGVVWVVLAGQMQGEVVPFVWASPQFTVPQFSVPAVMSLALPLFIVTMTSQNLPGVAVMRATGYILPISRLLTLTGLANLVLAPFGAFALNFAAVTAAMCMGEQSHPDLQRRYTATAVFGLLYLVIALCAAVVVGLLAIFPKELIAAIAGLALLTTIGGGLATALRGENHREAALITFLVTLSGMTLAGIGSAFWGVAAGSIALAVQQWGRASSETS